MINLKYKEKKYARLAIFYQLYIVIILSVMIIMVQYTIFLMQDTYYRIPKNKCTMECTPVASLEKNC